MAATGGRGRRAASNDGDGEGKQPAPPAEKGGGLFVVCRVDELPTVSVAAGEEPPAVRIGERLTVIKVVQSDSSDKAARDHKRATEDGWREARAKGEHPDFPDGLPEQFPIHRYRAISLGAFTPGYAVEEVREAKGSTF